MCVIYRLSRAYQFQYEYLIVFDRMSEQKDDLLFTDFLTWQLSAPRRARLRSRSDVEGTGDQLHGVRPERAPEAAAQHESLVVAHGLRQRPVIPAELAPCGGGERGQPLGFGERTLQPPRAIELVIVALVDGGRKGPEAERP